MRRSKEVKVPVWMSPWDWTATDWAGLTFIVLVGAAVVAWRQVREARRLREEQARPFVVIDFHLWSTIIELTITNIGKTLARDVSFSFDQPFVTTHDEMAGRGRVSDLNLFQRGIPSLAPGKEIRLFFDQFPARVERGLPMRYEVTASYQDPAGKAYSEPTVLDLETYLGTGGITRHDIHDVAKHLEVMSKEMKKWTAFGGGLKVMSPDDLRRRQEELDAYYAEQGGSDN